jgi:hypothetical protein
MSSVSKKIGKTDDCAKEFVIESLKNNETHGFDIDSLYFCNGRYYIFELLKCESSFVDPHSSHPRRYAYNWKKFYSLWNVAKELNAYLFLVNYSDGFLGDGSSAPPGYKDKVKLMYVKDFNFSELERFLANPIKTEKYDFLELEEFKMTREEFSDYLIKINNSSKIPTIDKVILPK